MIEIPHLQNTIPTLFWVRSQDTDLPWIRSPGHLDLCRQEVLCAMEAIQQRMNTQSLLTPGSSPKLFPLSGKIDDSLFSHWCNVSVQKKKNHNSKSYFFQTEKDSTRDCCFAKLQALCSENLTPKPLSFPAALFKQALVAMSGWHLLFPSGSVSPSKAPYSISPFLLSEWWLLLLLASTGREPCLQKQGAFHAAFPFWPAGFACPLHPCCKEAQSFQAMLWDGHRCPEVTLWC